jgi:hypothetical protein
LFSVELESRKMKFCIDCKWCKPWLGFLNYRDKQCTAPQNNREGELNPVDGKLFRKAEMCIYARRDEKLCGRDALWFENKFATSSVRPEVKASPRPLQHRSSNIKLEDLM